jgi:Family of unknown function (DUF6884)
VDRPTWSLILDAARELGAGGAEFTRAAIVDAVIRRDPRRRADSIGPVLQGMTRNAAGGPPSPCGKPLERVSHGWYRMAEAPVVTPAPQARVNAPASGGADLVLVGCVKTKADRPQAARDLYRSPLFERRRRYAEQYAARWYILSAEHGLVAPETVRTHATGSPSGYLRMRSSAGRPSRWPGWPCVPAGFTDGCQTNSFCVELP